MYTLINYLKEKAIINASLVTALQAIAGILIVISLVAGVFFIASAIIKYNGEAKDATQDGQLKSLKKNLRAGIIYGVSLILLSPILESVFFISLELIK